MLQRLLVIISLVLIIAGCKGNVAKDQSQAETDQKPATVEETVPQQPQDYNTVTPQASEEMNKQTEQKIEEVEVPDRIYFDLDSSNLSDASTKVLDTQIAWLKSDPSIKVIVEGHCDERGTREYNIALGERRAVATKKYLVQGGIEDSRIRTVSYGKERPAFVGTGEAIWSKNRRSVTVVEQ